MVSVFTKHRTAFRGEKKPVRRRTYRKAYRTDATKRIGRGEGKKVYRKLRKKTGARVFSGPLRRKTQTLRRCKGEGGQCRNRLWQGAGGRNPLNVDVWQRTPTTAKECKPISNPTLDQ